MTLTEKDIEEQVEEILREEHLLHEDKAPPLLNKIIIPTLSVLVLIMATLYLVFGPVDSTIRGRIESSVIENGLLSIGEYQLIFLNETSYILEQEYLNIQLDKQLETSICLLGTINNNTYTINELHFPRILKQTFNEVHFVPCPDETIVMLHTHPYKSCLASPQDKETLLNSQKKNKDLLMLVMCEEQRYNLYD